MSVPHHQPERDDELLKMFQQQQELGDKAPRQWPDGRLSADDDGQLAFKIGPENGQVKIEFPKPIAWIALPPEQAIELAQLLIKHARALHPGPIRINLH